MSSPTTEQVRAYAAQLVKQVMPDYSHDEKALHCYRKPDGSPLYWRMRVKTHAVIAADKKQKEIRPFWHNGKSFVTGEPPAPPEGKPLYALELLAMYPAAMVIVCEGENKADAINKAAMQDCKENQIVATTSGGASSATATNWQPLAGRVVVVWPDNDEAGAKYAVDVVEHLQGIAASVRVMDIAAFNLPPKGDAADYFKAGGTIDGLMQAIEAAQLVTQESDLSCSNSEGDATSQAWPMPQPLTAKIESELYPLDALPDTLRAAVEEVQAFVQAPMAMAATSAISALSLAIQALFDVQRAERLHSPVSLFTTIIASSGERKSTCDGFFAQVIRNYEAAQMEAAKPLVKDYHAAMGAWEAKRAGIKDKIRQSAKEKKPTIGLEADLCDLEHSKPKEPRIPRLLYGDITPEELAYKLAMKWPSGGVQSAEAGIVFGSHGMSGDSVMRNLARLNQLWDGNDLQIDRRTSESFTVHGARLSMGLQVQAETLLAFFEKSGVLARGTGFLARFLIAWPESTQGTRPFSEPPEHWPSLAAFNRRISELLNTSVPIDENGSLTPLMLTLTPEAKKAWIEYHDAIEAELAAGGELYDVRDVAAKSADNATRLAALFHVFEGGQGAIGIEAFDRASRIAAWHLNESRRFFGELALPAEVADAARLDRWLLEYCRREHTHYVARRYAQRHGTVRDGARLDIAISELVSLDRIQLRKDGKQLSIWINPALMSGVAS